MRQLLAALIAGGLIGYGMYVGTRVKIADWPMRLVWLGLGGVLIYALAGQAKAISLHIPFDGFSWVGVVALVVLDTGLGWVLWQRLPQEKR